jgi:Zn-dependent protease with chaperone function
LSDLGAFLTACLSSPALLTSACALIVVPTVAWLAVRALAPSLSRMVDDPGWQAPLAAAAAAMPGMLFLIVGAATLRGGWDSACLQFVSGKALYGAIAMLATFGFARASVLAARRVREVMRLLRQSSSPSERVRAAGDAAGVRIREVAADGPVMLLAGFLRPVVLVSADAVGRVNDAELLAAIRHEAAHFQRGDLLCAAVVAFIADLVPLPVTNFIAVYWRAREFAADAHAARSTDPCDLASALLALARPPTVSASIAAFADAGTVRDRLGVLLAPHPPQPSRIRRTLMTAVLATTFVLGAAPVLAAVTLGFTCTMVMPA